MIPGGLAPDILRRNEAVLDFTRSFFFQNKPVAAIREGIMVPLSAGMLEGRAVSAPWDLETVILSGSRHPEVVNWIDQDLVVDGNLITASSAWVLPQFTMEILDALASRAGYLSAGMAAAGPSESYGRWR